jgi:hypothetical protein
VDKKMEASDPAKRVLFIRPGGNGCRKRGRSKLRWCDELEDVARVGCRNWRINGQSRKKWQKLNEEVKTHTGM